MRTRKFLSTLIPALPMLLAALLVILVTVIFLTAMRSKAHAQFGGIEQPMFQLTSTASFTPQSIPGLAFYWVASDLPIGPVTNWVDRIQSSSWTNGDAAESPTNNTLLGVRFDGSPYHLTNNGTANLAGLSSEAVNTHWIVFYVERPAGFFTYSLLNSRTNGVAQRLANTDYIGDGRIVSGSTPFFFDTFFNITNAWVDFCNTEDGSTTRHYTNGVAGGTSTTTGPIQNNASWMWLGRNQAGSEYHKGYVREIAIWTNYTVTPSEITSLHNYATNIYGYSP